MTIFRSWRGSSLLCVAIVTAACAPAMPSPFAASSAPAGASRPTASPDPVPTATPISAPTRTPAPTPTPTPAPTLAPLAERLVDPDPRERLAAVLEVAGWADAEAVPILIAASEDADTAVSVVAIEGLGAIGGPEATKRLLALAAEIPDEADAGASARALAAVVGLGQAGGAAAIARLLELEAGEATPGAIRGSATSSLAMLEPADVSALGRALKHRDPAVVVGAIHRLTTIGTTAAIDLVIGQIKSKSAAVRKAAIGDLAFVGGSRVTRALVKALSAKQTRGAATAALVQLHAGDATPLLRYLKSAKTVKVFTAIIRIGQAGTEGALSTALAKFGDKGMALDYLNCGNPALDKAARRWASRHGYYVVTTPGVVGTVAWGR
jgi:HEAT repeat protein